MLPGESYRQIWPTGWDTCLGPSYSYLPRDSIDRTLGWEGLVQAHVSYSNVNTCALGLKMIEILQYTIFLSIGYTVEA